MIKTSGYFYSQHHNPSLYAALAPQPKTPPTHAKFTHEIIGTCYPKEKFSETINRRIILKHSAKHRNLSQPKNSLTLSKLHFIISTADASRLARRFSKQIAIEEKGKRLSLCQTSLSRARSSSHKSDKEEICNPEGVGRRPPSDLLSKSQAMPGSMGVGYGERQCLENSFSRVFVPSRFRRVRNELKRLKTSQQE